LPEKAEKIKITSQIRKGWFLLRNAWLHTLDVFSNQLAQISDKDAEELYKVVRCAVYKDSYAQILREHPELKELVKTDDDRYFMHDVYENLSWRLGKKEPLPKDKKLISAMKGKIGRAVPDL